MPYWQLEKEIEAVGEVGFQGISPTIDKLDRFLATHGVSDLRKLLSRYDLGVPAIDHLRILSISEEEALARAKKYFEVAHSINSEGVMFLPDQFIERNKDDVKKIYAERLRKIATLGEKYNVKALFEWIGLLGLSLQDGIEILKIADSDNLYQVFDVYHWYTSIQSSTPEATRVGLDLSEIDLIPRGQIAFLHISDHSPRLPLTERLFCGYGGLPLVEILRRLERLGFDGYINPENINSAYRFQDPYEVIRTTYKTLKEVMQKANVW